MNTKASSSNARIGLVAHTGGGKGTALNIFRSFGYKTFTFSDTLKEVRSYFQDVGVDGESRFNDLNGIQDLFMKNFGESIGSICTIDKLEEEKKRKKGIFVLAEQMNTTSPITLRDVGDALRNQLGRDILAVGALEWMRKQSTGLLVVEGSRIPEEAVKLKAEGIWLLGIDLDEKKRKELIFNRKREDDATESRESFERNFAAVMAREGNEIDACLMLCDKVIPNNTGIADFEKRIEAEAYIRRVSYEGSLLGYYGRK